MLDCGVEVLDCGVEVWVYSVVVGTANHMGLWLYLARVDFQYTPHLFPHFLKGSTFGDVGIFIKSLTVGGAAEVDGRLSSGDQIIMVDGQSLEGASQQE